MKKISILMTVVALAVFVYAQQPATQEAPKSGAAIAFTEVVHDFGNIEVGTKAETRFEFTNTGTEPLVLSKVQPSCGCTASDYTKTPVEPGQKGYVSALYKNTSSANHFEKSISVYSNAGATPTIRLTIKGNVVDKPAAPVQEKSAISSN